jgi:hypothetical protein
MSASSPGCTPAACAAPAAGRRPPTAGSTAATAARCWTTAARAAAVSSTPSPAPPSRATQRTCAELLLILRGIAQGVPTALLARELGCDRKHLLELRHRLQDLAEHAAEQQLPLTAAAVEADELYQNAGEKRHPAPRPPRPAPASRQQAARARHLGQRPAAGGRLGRP